MTRRKRGAEGSVDPASPTAGDPAVDPLGETLQGGDRAIESLQATIRHLFEELQTERERAQLVSDQLASWHDLLISLTDGVVVVDASDRIVAMNPTGQSLLGIHPRTGTSLARLRTGLDLRFLDERPVPFEERPFNRARRGEVFADYELVVYQADGSPRHLRFSGSSVRDRSGQVMLAILVFNDVTGLRRLEKLKEENVSLVSHDLRAPLTIITGRAALLRRRFAQEGSPEDVQSVEAIQRSAHRMEAMIQDMIDTSRLETGRIELHRVPTDLIELIGDLVDAMTPSWERSRVQIRVHDDVPVISLDRGRIERVVTNLLTNALKYSPADAPVTIDVRQSDREEVVSITDHGSGIPHEELPRLFQKYVRAGVGRRGTGLGLGLYIARMIVEASGGRIGATSTLGKGSTFWFSLPEE